MEKEFFGVHGALQNNCIDLSVGIEFHKTIDYDRKAMRQALVRGAAKVRKDARRFIARRAISSAFEMPGYSSGAMSRAIGIVSRGSRGGWVKVGVRTIPNSVFYPAFLFYGSPKTGLEKRGNFITVALADAAPEIKRDIQAALKNSLVPR